MADTKLNGQQVLLLPEGATRLLGRDAQRTNIAVAIAVANAIKTTLGPKGMDKMLVSDLGDIVITNDGATIMDEMNVEHPVAKIMVDIAKTQDKEVGDGTTTVVVIAGNLLKGAEDLIDQGIHPTVIIKGYKTAAARAAEVLEKYSKAVDSNDEATLQKIALVSIGSKNIGDDSTKAQIAKLIIKAVKQVMDKKGDNTFYVDHDFIKIEKKAGGNISDTQLINGVLIDKEVAHPGMPKLINNAKVALLDVALEIEKTETDAKIEITSPEQMQQFLQQEERMLKEMVEKIKKSGATVVFTQKGIDDVAQHYLAKEGIMAARRIKKSDVEKLSRATGATIVTSLDDLSSKDLGYAGVVEERKISGEQMIFVEKCKDPKSVTIFIRGGTQQVVDEAERSIQDVIGAVSTTIESGGKYVPGGGNAELHVAEELRAYASEVGGREQLAIQKFADAVEIIPKVLAENAGMDSIDTIVQMRSKHKAKESKYFGVDVYGNRVADMEKIGVLEPTKMKEQALYSASEAAEIILRIDDIISSKGRSGAPSGPGGGYGQGGMPGEGMD
ncbi:MAG: TCP-1/cpn60 chaperonin family protein [Candidatus Micrarchaeales archaeon]|jgi:thermosome|uniref:Thermosome n=1 Tax=Candidatus Micrarchaeum acidiphilum ARMAN-2 TaxID=425595 RepID=C7DI88_MICA2|nr:MAG: thermosome [Candidatus Micrarchaeum acidiphilum ARMAN-2]MCW6160913.1 TCP-1/cpn60 chaperonin family protein [Candidatus Micrarchaeales archaeon]